MFKKFTNWYSSTPEQVRYWLVYLISLPVGLSWVLWMLWSGADYKSALGWGALFGLIAFLVIASPMIVADLLKEKITFFLQLDEMEKQINMRARAVTAIVFYLYFYASIVAIILVAWSNDTDMVPLSYLIYMFLAV